MIGSARAAAILTAAARSIVDIDDSALAVHVGNMIEAGRCDIRAEFDRDPDGGLIVDSLRYRVFVPGLADEGDALPVVRLSWRDLEMTQAEVDAEYEDALRRLRGDLGGTA